ncbi:MAG TPA: phosphoglycerate dehydrogenase [Pirellulaceae bacterium]|mgnify:CR=1 FL=1|nr:phosphoglycerate dehydrogenase [Pirellulaceae bacterium]HMO94236.1 phosphoglycerate dehydrogenase [Pirellulaceae bacterium]HMP70809.1 phosphoglycerate dehydrogenase [Pirellulaceae bacterium]
MSTAAAPVPAPVATKTRIIILDDIADEGLALLNAAPGIEFDIRTGLKGEDLRRALAEYDGAVCRSGVKITAESLEGNRRLRAIVRAGVGTDNIDKSAATRLGIIVMNTPDGNTVSTAELTMALILGLSRKLAPAFASLQAGKWDRKSFQGTQLSGKKIGVIGLGRIGVAVAKRCLAFGMEVIGYDPFLSADKASELGITKVETVDELVPLIDYLTVHTPLTPETKHLIGAAQIERMKQGVRMINCARGGIYDEAALVEGLRSGKLGGVALDVYSEEPCTDSPLFSMPNVLCTPHLGASTDEAQIEVAVEAVDLLIKYLTTGEIRSAVNALSLDPQTLSQMRGYLDVAYRLGAFVGQWHGGTLDSCELDMEGEISSRDTRILVSSFCAGLIGDKIEGANIVNAEMLCRERGIEIVHRTQNTPGSFSSVIGAKVSGEGRSLQAAATLFGKSMPRLVRLGEFRTDACMDGVLLIFSHTDQPGIIGYVGQILAEQDVNITQMVVARDRAAGAQAIGVLSLDNSVNDEALKKIMQHAAVDSAKLVVLPPAGKMPDWLS